MSKCQICQADGLEFHESLRININPITGQKHGPQFCKVKRPAQPIPLYEKINDITCDPNEYWLANRITRGAELAGLDAFKVRVERRGSVLILH